MSRPTLEHSGLPRVWTNHRTREGIAYRRYVVGLIARLTLDARDPSLVPLLREAGVLAVELTSLHAMIERARQQKADPKVLSLSRVARKTRMQLVNVERHLAECAGPKRAPSSISDLVAARDARSGR